MHLTQLLLLTIRWYNIIDKFSNSWHGVKYTFIPLMRNNRLYELSVYRGKKLLFCLRDSLTLLPASLNNLAINLCPELGSKGSIPHDEVEVSNLIPFRSKLFNYMKQDILLLALGGVMSKAQDIYWALYKVDIVTKLTLSSLALSIFRTNYYDPKTFPIPGGKPVWHGKLEGQDLDNLYGFIDAYVDLVTPCALRLLG